MHDGVSTWKGSPQANGGSSVIDDGLPRLILPHLQLGSSAQQFAAAMVHFIASCISPVSSGSHMEAVANHWLRARCQAGCMTQRHVNP